MLGCDDKALKKLTLSSRSEESCSAVVQLLERVSGLQRDLEQRQSQEETEQVQTSQLGWVGGLGWWVLPRSCSAAATRDILRLSVWC